jgi:hypothetical protein
MKQNAGAGYNKFYALLPMSSLVKGSLTIRSDQEDILTITLHVASNKVGAIEADGTPSTIFELRSLMEGNRFFGLPLIGYAIDDSNEEHFRLNAQAKSY